MTLCFSHKRTLKEITHLNGSDDSGYIDGTIFMVWPPRKNTHQIYFQVIEESTPYRFPVNFPYQDGIVFRSQDRITLSLKGVRVNQCQESSAQYSFPISLCFPDGVAFKYLSRNNVGGLVDTWEGWYMHAFSSVI